MFNCDPKKYEYFLKVIYKKYIYNLNKCNLESTEFFKSLCSLHNHPMVVEVHDIPW